MTLSTVAVALAVSAGPSATAVPYGAGATEYVLALSGGASRGAYQAGALWAILRGFEAAGRELPDWRKMELVGLSGSSIGAVNALVAALEWCRIEVRGRPEENLLWSIWRDLSWSSLFPGDLSCREYAERHPEMEPACIGRDGAAYGPSDSVFTAGALSSIRRTLSRLIADARGFRAGCHLPLAVTLTAEDPLVLTLGGKFEIPTSRRMIAVELQAESAGQGAALDSGAALHLCDLVPSRWSDPGAQHEDFGFARRTRLSLPQLAGSTACNDGRRGVQATDGELVPAQLFDAVLASASTPGLLVPQTITYCSSDACEPATVAGVRCPGHTHACKARFFDGGVFGEKPLPEAMVLLPPRSTGDTTPQRTIVVLDTRARRAGAFDRLAEAETTAAREQPRGFAYYGDVARSFVEVAGSYELQTLHRYGLLPTEPEGDPHLGAVLRSRPIVADLRMFNDSRALADVMSSMTAFFDIDFRRHDFYVGVYEGMRWLANERCRQIHGTCVLKTTPWALIAARSDANDGLHDAALREIERLGGDSSLDLHERAGQAIAREWQTFRSAFDELAGSLHLERAPGLVYVVSHALAKDEAILPACQGVAGEPVSCGRQAVHLEAKRSDLSAFAQRGTRALALAEAEGGEIRVRAEKVASIWRALEQVSGDAGGPADQIGADLGSDDFGRFASALQARWREPGLADDFTFDREDSPPYVSNYRYWRYELLRKALGRLAAVDRADGSAATASGLTFAEYVAAVAASTWRTGWGVGRSTIPSRVARSEILATAEKLVLPAAAYYHGRGSYGGVAGGTDYGFELGWDFLAYDFGAPYAPGQLHDPFVLMHHPQLGFSAQWLPAANTGRWSFAPTFAWSVNPLVGARWTGWVPETGARLRWSWGPAELPGNGPLAAGLFIRPLYGRIEIGYQVPHLDHFGAGGHVYVGLLDVNGLLYWALRGFAGGEENYPGAQPSSTGFVNE